MNTTTPMGMLQQPRPFFMIFFVELWERFGYYGVQGVLAVFFVKQLGFSQEQAFVTFGAFAALVYGLISIGGYVGDHLLGTKRTIVLGALVLAIGYFMTGMSLLKPDLIFIALGTIAVGNGLFKANPASLLSKCYPPKDPRLDGAFTLFYMSINIGSLIALSLAPVIADRFGYSVTYNLCGAGLIIALLVYIACRGMVKDIGSEPDFRPMSFSKLLYVLLGSVVLGMFMCSLGFLTAAAAGMWFADAQGLTSPWFIVLVYLFQSLGELFISALGLAMIAALVPQHLMGFILGMWFLTQAAAFLLGGYVATFTAVPDNITDPLETLPVYTNVFGKIGLVTLGVAVVMLLMVPWLKRMIATPESH